MQRGLLVSGRDSGGVVSASGVATVGLTVGVASTCWVLALQQMNGMDMGVATRLGSFASFIAVWAAMMAAMMLPGAIPAVVRHAATRGHVRAAPLFVGSYLAVWAAAGVAVYALYRPHGTTAAGVAVVAAGVYELTPLKRHFRRCCRERVGSGFGFGIYCVGSSAGLMLMLVLLGVMSITWMIVIAALAVGQKLLPPKAGVDVPVALAIVALGIVILIAPAAVPGLAPAMGGM